MAKRHPSLVPLSHDHHHTLALALRLRQGTDALLNDGWTHDRNEQANRVRDFHAKELRAHFAAEEEVVFPAMKEHVANSLAMVDTLVTQHREIEKLIERLVDAEEPVLGETLIALGTILEQHIRIEERELFPLFQSAFSPELAEEIGRRITLVQERFHPVTAAQTSGTP